MHLQSPPFWWFMTNWLKFSTGIEVCEIVKDLSIVFVSRRRAPPEDVHISTLPLNANAHGRLYLRSSSSTDEDNSSCMKWYNEDNDMHNEKWTSAEWLRAKFIIAHAEFIVASQNSRKSSRRPSSLSVTTQRTKCIKNESCKHLAKVAKSKASPLIDPLEDYQTHMLLPLLSLRTKKVWRHRAPTRSHEVHARQQGRRWEPVVQRNLV